MDGLDLELNNYNLTDLLKLFNFDYDFDKNALKQAKKIVFMTHPDKSGLDKEYFLFFSSAYKVIYKIYEFRYKSENKNTEYTVEKNESNEELLKTIKNTKNFNKWFNLMFETNTQLKNDDRDYGYGDWIKSNENLDDRVATKDTMNSIIDEKKREIRQLTVYKTFSELNSQSGLYELTMERPETYSSDIFSKLQYDDLKRAHTETVVPVTMDDYISKKKYNNVNELQNDRASNDIVPLSYNQATDYLNRKKELETKTDIERAYKLARQEEDVRKINNNWWSKIKYLTNE